ncbi:MAG: glycerophosphodiester phosphodiesterase family protein [Balneolaceae bacterium]|nr:glycerophosphodiester phosphodiesterase family protein [Balneolaceae bacterium]
MSKSTLTHLAEKKFLVIAHRGASHYAPENTISAFKLAHKMKADMIELDVQLSKDGVPVVFHDYKLNRHSNGNGVVSSFLFDELQQLDAGKWFSIEFMGEKIPSLEEVLRWAAGKILVNIEIKKEAVGDLQEGGVEEKVAELVHQLGMERNVIISSFDYRAVDRTKKIAPEMLTGLLYHQKKRDNQTPVELLKKYEADFFHCSKSEMSNKWRMELKSSEKRFLIYTVNRKKAMRRWIENGAFGIFSNRPDQLRAVVEEYFEKSA